MKPLQNVDLKTGVKKFRPELEGVRAVAAMLVALYHIWVGSVSGGVDVFFIVSGYLITTSLLSKMVKDGRIKYFDYLLGLGKRLFPNAFIVLLFATIASFLLMPQVQWKQIISEVFASAFYYQNWQLALNAVDYLAQHNEASPLQHFWALSIQGQFYLTWPLIIFVTYLLATKWLKTPPRKTLLFVLTAIFAASLAYSIYVTATNQPWAYFDTFARVWEFSLGGILALLIPYLSFPKPISAALGWIGLATICLTGILLPVSTVFPGYAALLPITGVMLVIVSAENSASFGVTRMLGSKPFMFFGGISYAFYLWHWPLLLFYYAYFKTDTVSLGAGLAILLLTFLLSIITTKIVEAPIRKQSTGQSKLKLASLLAAFVLPVVIANLFWNVHIDRTQEAFRQQVERGSLLPTANPHNSDSDNPDPDTIDEGAIYTWETIGTEETPVLEGTEGPPSDLSLSTIKELPFFYKEVCYVGMKSRGLKVCSYGETEDPAYTLALVGGSRSGHWFPALEAIADQLKLRIDVYNKDACRFTTEDFGGALSDSCMEWNGLAMEELLENPPDILMTTANVDEDDFIPEGYIDMWKKFEGVTTVFAIRDNPSMPHNIPVCVEKKGAGECSVPRDEVLSPVAPWDNAEQLPDNVYFADLSDYLCDADTCHAVIGDMLVYRDKHHFSTLFVTSLAEPLKEELLAVLEELDTADANNDKQQTDETGQDEGSDSDPPG